MSKKSGWKKTAAQLLAAMAGATIIAVATAHNADSRED